MKKGYRIISIEATDIYKQEQENGVSVGYKMPESKSKAYFRLFKNILDDSLDCMELEKVYKKICRKKFSFQDKNENLYTLAVVNVKFNYKNWKKIIKGGKATSYCVQSRILNQKFLSGSIGTRSMTIA